MTNVIGYNDNSIVRKTNWLTMLTIREYISNYRLKKNTKAEHRFTKAYESYLNNYIRRAA